MISLEGVEKRYGRRVALRPLHLHVPAGRIVALVGSNGAGKSTALGIAAGQVIPDGGRVLLAGHDLVRAPIDARRVLGYLPQDSPLPRALTVEETLGFFAAVRGLTVAAVAPLVALAGLEADRATLTRELSGGSRRKLAFACALTGGPRSLVLDEPFAGLDEVARARFEEALRERRAAGAGILLAGHDLGRTLSLADSVVVLSAGEVVHRGPAAEIDPSDLRELIADGT